MDGGVSKVLARALVDAQTVLGRRTRAVRVSGQFGPPLEEQRQLLQVLVAAK